MIKRTLFELKAIKESLNKLPKDAQRSKVYYYLDMIACVVKYGAIAEDYIALSFYNKSSNERRQFITCGNKRGLLNTLYTPPSLETLNKKYLFNKKFNAFVKRDWLYTQESTKEEIEKFVNKHGRVIIKPEINSCGTGVHIIETHEIDKEISELLRAGYMMEEVLENHPDLKRLNPTSLQTYRVETCIDTKGIVHIMNQCLMMGAPQSIVSNCHSGGCMAHINIKTGCVETDGYNPNGWSTECHPATGIKIKGYKVPLIEQLESYVQKVALTMPEARYVGWDITVTKDGEFELIEGNYFPGHVTQHCDDKPRLSELLEYASGKQ